MTLPPEKIGDKGQRYEIWCDEEDGESLLIGWSDTPDGFKESVDSHPGWTHHRAVDRWKVERCEARNTAREIYRDGTSLLTFEDRFPWLEEELCDE